MKRCPECGITKNDTDFSLNAGRPDGLKFYCKVCFRRRGAEAYRRRQARRGKSVRHRPEPLDGNKWCPGCERMQPFSNWHKTKSQASGFVIKCKDCKKQESRADHLRRSFGLSVADHEQLLAQQGGVCAICGDESPAHTDHDHGSGQVRGLLCARCNLGIGQFLDDPVRMEAAIAYLDETSASADPDSARRRLQRLFPSAG
jgi:hypothetical protein